MVVQIKFAQRFDRRTVEQRFRPFIPQCAVGKIERFEPAQDRSNCRGHRDLIGDLAIAQTEVFQLREKLAFEQWLQIGQRAVPAIAVVPQPQFEMLQGGKGGSNDVGNYRHAQTTGFDDQRFKLFMLNAPEGESVVSAHPKMLKCGIRLEQRGNIALVNPRNLVLLAHNIAEEDAFQLWQAQPGGDESLDQRFRRAVVLTEEPENNRGCLGAGGVLKKLGEPIDQRLLIVPLCGEAVDGFGIVSRLILRVEWFHRVSEPLGIVFEGHNFFERFTEQNGYQSGMHPQRTISMIAWDLDNTLIDRDAGLRAFFADWLTRRFPSENIAPLLASICAADRSGDGDRMEFCARVLEQCGHPKSGAAELWSELQRELPGRVILDPRVERLLDSLSSIYPMRVATNGGGILQRAKIRAAGLDRWFEKGHVFVSAEIGARKPERAFFDAVLTASSISPTEVLFVGDHPDNDVRAAAACGFQTCWVSLGRVRPDALPADFSVERVWELETLLSSALAAR
jgi:putative hydrolase of the HAD superfamily